MVGARRRRVIWAARVEVEMRHVEAELDAREKKHGNCCVGKKVNKRERGRSCCCTGGSEAKAEAAATVAWERRET